jgi:hypothetical protein
MATDIGAWWEVRVSVESGEAVEGNEYWKKFLETSSSCSRATDELGGEGG